MESDFTPSSEALDVDFGAVEQDTKYTEEFNRLIEWASQEVYDGEVEPNPFQMTYKELARMSVLCYRLYVGLRSAEDRVDGLLEALHREKEGNG